MAARRKAKSSARRHPNDCTCVLCRAVNSANRPKKITEEDVKAAVDVISSAYWQDVRECAADFVDQFQKGEFKD